MVNTSQRFWGQSFGGFQRDLVSAWRGMLRWPFVAWWAPQADIRLHRPTGRQALHTSLNSGPFISNKRLQQAKFDAVLLPEDLLLRRTVRLPNMQADAQHEALALEAHACSPFAATDLLWCSLTTLPVPAHTVEVLPQTTLVLCSVQLVRDYLAKNYPIFDPAQVEIWVADATGQTYALVPGFGEARRMRQLRRSRWAIGLASCMAVALGLGIVMTPTIKLYLQAQQAKAQFESLRKKAGPVMVERESMLKLAEQVTAIKGLQAAQPEALQAMQVITTALPDDTWLMSLQMQGDKIIINGQTNNTAALMKHLGEIPALRNVKAPTPASKPLGSPKEIFVIEFTLAQSNE